MSTSTPSLYEVLEVAPEADRQTLARAWRLRRDRVASEGLEAHEAEALCAKLDEAFAILANPVHAERYRTYRSGARPTAPYAMEFGRDDAVRGNDDKAQGMAAEPFAPPVHDDASWTEAPTSELLWAVNPELSLPVTEPESDSISGKHPGFVAPKTRERAHRSQARSEARRRPKSERLLKTLTSAPWL